MIRTDTLVRYLTDDQYFGKLMSRLNKNNESLAGQWIIIDSNDAMSGKYTNLDLYRKDSNVVFTISGTPACIAAYAGNTRMVDYLIQNELLNDMPDEPYTEDEGLGKLFYPEISCIMMYENKDSNKSNYPYLNNSYMEYFKNISPISFTLPQGNLECFKIMMEAGQICDFKNRENFKLLSFCRNKSFWKFLVDSNILDRSLLLLALDYAFYYRNSEITNWLIRYYSLI